MRGEPNVQGATDVACTVPDLPGYLKWPTAKKHRHLADYLHAETYADGYYSNKPKFMGFVPQGVLRRKRDSGKRLRL